MWYRLVKATAKPLLTALSVRRKRVCVTVARTLLGLTKGMETLHVSSGIHKEVTSRPAKAAGRVLLDRHFTRTRPPFPLASCTRPTGLFSTILQFPFLDVSGGHFSSARTSGDSTRASTYSSTFLVEGLNAIFLDEAPTPLIYWLIYYIFDKIKS